MEVKKPICIFGGTFDPVHLGHINLAHYVLKKFQFEKIIFVPCKIPVHKMSQATTIERLEMLQLALADEPAFVIDRREIDRDTPSYMVPTLESFRIEHCDHPICFVIGLDSFLTLDSWHQWEKLLDLTHLLIAPRVGYDLPSMGIIAELLQKHRATAIEELIEEKNGRILVLDTEPSPISATLVREKINKKEEIKHLLPTKVYDYIHSKKLYHAN